VPAWVVWNRQNEPRRHFVDRTTAFAPRDSEKDEKPPTRQREQGAEKKRKVNSHVNPAENR
jgi:hypothetical protein